MKFEKNVVFNLPVLVTRGLVLFPNQTESIYVERSFSIQAVNTSKDTYESYLLVVSQKDLTKEKISSMDDIYKIGTLCRITSIITIKDGYRIKINALERIKLENFLYLNDTIYSDALIYDDQEGELIEEQTLLKNLFSTLEKYNSQIINNNGKDILAGLSKGMTALNISYLLASTINVYPEEKQELLEAETINIRLMRLIVFYDRILKSVEVERKIQDDIKDSTEKNQKEYILREKLKAIKKELNNGDDNDSDDIMKKVEEGEYPDHIKSKIKDEMKKFDMLPQGSLEGSLIRTYVDLLLALPWYRKTEDTTDLKQVEKVLNDDHFGLEKPKKRILEYLAVKQMTGNLKAPILCFYGPPGTGKTSLGKSIARALNRKFLKVALGGISDEAEIRGHRRTYVASSPGRIIQGIKKVDTNNPVILLDEIDKLDQSFHGNPASALLEVLDPEQNNQFTDNYLEEPFDLSNVLFICTANYLNNIPTPLLDRIELIELNSYTAFEKLNITKQHLIDKALKANGLTDKQIKFTDNAIDFMIERYTHEAGVRELERLVNSICRKVCVDILNNKFESIEITPHDVKVYLGIEIYDYTKKETESQVGVVTGLAWTQYGGDIMPIEVNYFPGKGNLILTGKLGDVMKESCSIALDYVKSKASKYGIDYSLFEKNDIHVHFAEGAVPKDGPSAGVAITIALISCLTNKPVSGDIAMTGEVTLRGNALPIGGLREKSLAALRSGIKTIIVPIKNKNNVNELPKEVKDNLNIVLMETVDDAYKVIFKD